MSRENTSIGEPSQLFGTGREGFTTRPVVTGRKGVVTAGHYLATAAGMRMFERGGNAVDAGVAAGLALTVLKPQDNGIGGEVPILVYSAREAKVFAISGQGWVAKAATNVQSTLGRVDSATNQGQLATILNNSAATSANLKSASQDFRELLDAAHKNQESLVRVLVSADSVMSRIANRSGTLGLLVSDSTLYRETTLTMIQLRQLLSDIQANPRKYFSFSVF